MGEWNKEIREITPWELNLQHLVVNLTQTSVDQIYLISQYWVIQLKEQDKKELE